MNDLEFYNSFRFILYELSHNQSKTFHHIKHHFIVYVYEGTARFSCENTSFVVSPGDFFYLPKGITYTSSWQSTPGIRFASMGFKYFPHAENIHYPMQKIASTPETVALVNQMVSNLRVSCSSVGTLYQLFGCMLEKMTYSVSSKYAVLVDTAERYWIQYPFASGKEIAQYCSTSKSVLYHAFRFVRNCTLVEAKHRLLVNSAVELLKSTDKSIEEISAQLGFSSAAYFRKVFKGQMHASPRDIRKSTVPILSDLM